LRRVTSASVECEIWRPGERGRWGERETERQRDRERELSLEVSEHGVEGVSEH
jgi:hypothetical protein